MIFENNRNIRLSIITLCGQLLLTFGVFSCGNSEKPAQTSRAESDVDTSAAIKTYSDLEQSLISQGLVDIQELAPDIIVDLKYSSTDNFFQKDAYGDTERAFLQRKPATALKLAQYLLKKQYPYYTLLVFDAARPLSVQKILWESLDSIPVKNRKNFVADPLEGSIHNYGCAVDLTIFDTDTNSEIDMGTPFDYFGDLAYPRKEKQLLINGKLTENQIKNRRLLRDIMLTVGYDPITSEWWHFNFYSLANAKKMYSIVE